MSLQTRLKLNFISGLEGCYFYRCPTCELTKLRNLVHSDDLEQTKNNHALHEMTRRGHNLSNKVRENTKLEQLSKHKIKFLRESKSDKMTVLLYSTTVQS